MSWTKIKRRKNEIHQVGFRTEKQEYLKLLLAGMLLCTCILCNRLSQVKLQSHYRLQKRLLYSVEQIYFPNITYWFSNTNKESKNFFKQSVLQWFPLIRYVEQEGRYDRTVEDPFTLQRILASQSGVEQTAEQPEMKTEELPKVENIVPQTGTTTADLSIEKLRDFDYLLSHFYVVDGSTMIGPDQLNPDDLLSREMHLNDQEEGPKVLIFHTHSQEAFADSVPGDSNTSIVGIGEYLAQLLNAKGIETLHDPGVYDIINGQLDRSSAYENAEASIRPILDANPSIEVVIDLHRDGVSEETHLVTEIGGKPTAKIMYFNGLSRTRVNGDIAYLYNPYIQDNLAFSLQMPLASERLYPGVVRPIYLRGYRYNLHLRPKSLLIEAGAQTNTVEEMRNAMEVLAETLYQVLTGKISEVK